MPVDIVRPSELTPALIAAWRRFQAADADLGSPFLTPEWVQVAEQADGPGRVRVAVEHEAGEPRAFLAVRAGRRVAVAVGAPMSDYQAVLAEPRWRPDLDGLLRALDIHRFDFTHVPLNGSALAAGARGSVESRLMDLSGGWNGVVGRLKGRGSGLLKDLGNRRRRAEREGGPVTVVIDDPDPEALERLIAWKREQYKRTRQTDVLAPEWARRLLRGTVESAGPTFRGRFNTLRIDGQPVAAHLALHSGTVAHAWFLAHDAAASRMSPGLLLLVEIARRLAEEGTREFDLGPGEDDYKRRVSDGVRPVGYGFVGRLSAAAMLRGAAYGLRGWAEAAPLGFASQWPGKAMRRWDVIRALR